MELICVLYILQSRPTIDLAGTFKVDFTGEHWFLEPEWKGSLAHCWAQTHDGIMKHEEQNWLRLVVIILEAMDSSLHLYPLALQHTRSWRMSQSLFSGPAIFHVAIISDLKASFRWETHGLKLFSLAALPWLPYYKWPIRLICLR